jgi:hypothetical protein
LTADENTKEQTFAQRLTELMDEHDPPIGIKELAAKIGYCCEHTRKIVRGTTLPRPPFILSVAALFQVDADELRELVTRDNYLHEFGPKSRAAISDPGLASVLKDWPQLTDDEQADVLSMMLHFVRENACKAEMRLNDLHHPASSEDTHQ